MSVNLISVSEPQQSDASLKTTEVGGSKPLHRFIKGQPKITGVIVLILGSSFFIISIAALGENIEPHLWTTITSGFWLGALFIMCGIQYVVTEHNTTKKTVTISLALSIVALLGSVWTLILLLSSTASYRSEDYVSDENVTETDDHNWTSHYSILPWVLEIIVMIYVFMGAAIFTVMSILAGSAVRSTKSKAVIMMSTKQTE